MEVVVIFMLFCDCDYDGGAVVVMLMMMNTLFEAIKVMLMPTKAYCEGETIIEDEDDADRRQHYMYTSTISTTGITMHHYQ